MYTNIIDSLWCMKHVDVPIEHYTCLLDEETNTHSIFAGKLQNNLGAAYDLIDNNGLAIKHYNEALSCYFKESETFSKQIAIT